MLKQQRADFILHKLNEIYPETPIPLDHNNNFELLVAVLLSAQCTDIRVNQVTPALFSLADNAFDMQHVPLDSIYKIVRPCGLAPQKSSAISTLSKMLVEQYNGEVPDDWKALESLPGVGHKTAGVVMSQGFGHPAFPWVDPLAIDDSVVNSNKSVIFKSRGFEDVDECSHIVVVLLLGQ